MSELVFVMGKWEGAAPCDLDLGDLVWVMRNAGHQVDRALAFQDLMRRQRAARQRRANAQRNSRPRRAF